MQSHLDHGVLGLLDESMGHRLAPIGSITYLKGIPDVAGTSRYAMLPFNKSCWQLSGSGHEAKGNLCGTTCFDITPLGLDLIVRS